MPLLAPSGSIITLQTTATALPVNGSTDIIAQLIEPAGTPPQRGTLVSFTTTLGSIEPSQAETDISGRVVVKFLAGGGSGTATISAISGGVAVVAANALRILVGTAAVGSVRVSANPTLLPATGGSSTITAQALDINGNPLSSAPVNFSTTAGTLDQGFAITDQSGLASTVLRTSTQATVTAAIGAQAGSTTPPPTGTPTTPTPTPPAASGQASGTVVVNVSGAPTIVITPPATPPSAGIPASFTIAVTPATANGSAIRSVSVNWGDGQIQELGVVSGNAVVSHTYGSQGTYTILATATDSFGNVVNVSSSVAVNPRPQPTVTLTGPTAPPTAGTDTQFTGSVAPVANGSVITNVVMDYGDGTVQNLGAITGSNIALHHVYQSGGTFTAKLTATDSNGGVGASATSVFVQGATPLAVSLTSSQVSSGTNTTVTFTATVIGLGNAVVVNYHWVFGGPHPPADTTSNQQTRTYAAGSGPITVSVTVTTSDGRTATGNTVITP